MMTDAAVLVPLVSTLHEIVFVHGIVFAREEFWGTVDGVDFTCYTTNFLKNRDDRESKIDRCGPSKLRGGV